MANMMIDRIKRTMKVLGLNVLILSFSDEQLEKKYIEKHHELNIRYNRNIFIYSIVVVTVFIGMMYFLKHVRPMEYIISTYLNIVIPTILVIIVSLTPFSMRIIQATMTISLIVINIACMLAMIQYPDSEGYIVHSAFLLVVIGELAFLHIRFTFALVLFIITFLVYEFVFQIFAPFNKVDVMIFNYLFVCAIIIGITTNYRIEKRDRHDFYKLQIIVEDRLKLSNLREPQ